MPRSSWRAARSRSIDNQIDTTTGTLRLKATFPNADQRLWPGQFVNVRLLLAERKGVVTVPQRTVMQGPGGYFAYVVKPDGTAERRTLELGGTQDGIAVILRGIAAGETVVVEGQYRLTDGARVQIGPSAPPPPRGERRRGPTPKTDRRHEHLRVVHPPAHRHLAADGGPAGAGQHGLHAAARRRPARCRFPDHLGRRQPAGRQPGDHGDLGRHAARACSSPPSPAWSP